jgi:hypothetical protein
MSRELLRIIETPPPRTETHTVCGICYRVDSDNEWRGFPVRIGFHPATVFPSILAYTWLLSHVFFFIGQIVPSIPPTYRRWILCVYCFLWVCAVVNYAASYLSNPGLLPWDWWHTRKDHYTIDELRNGIATNADQVMWAKVQRIPNRGTFRGNLDGLC